MRSVLVVVVAASTACSGPGKPPPAAPPPHRAPGARPPVTAEAFCEHLTRITAKCSQLAGARPDPNTCVAEFRDELASPERRERTTELARCFIDHDDCDGVLDCVAAGSHDPTAAQALRACDDSSGNASDHAVGLARAEWEQRNGARVTLFRDARSTKAAPIEMCGVPAANHWLTTLRCNDGSQPIRDSTDAEDARPGNIGPGGRCHSIIDRYLVLCPERRYEIFIDAYLCPRPE